MSPPTMFGPVGHFLIGHLNGLNSSLASLGRQIPASVAGAVGRAAAEAVRQGVTFLFRAPRECAEEAPLPYRRDDHSLQAMDESARMDDWREPGESCWGNTRQRWQTDNDNQLDDDYLAQEPDSSVVKDWRLALAAGCRLLAWWTGRLARPGAAKLALGVGLTTALAIYLAGPGPGPGPMLVLTDALALVAFCIGLTVR